MDKIKAFIKKHEKVVIGGGLVVIFVIIFLIGLRNDVQAAEFEARVGLGTQVVDRSDRGEHIAADLMIMVNKNWYANIQRYGNGTVVPDTNRVSAGWRVEWREDTDLEPYMRFGMAYWFPEDSGLVTENWTYDMIIGVRLWKVFEAEIAHSSTAGRADRNTGVDMLFVGAVLPFR